MDLNALPLDAGADVDQLDGEFARLGCKRCQWKIGPRGFLIT